jgi:hypothetical protein
MKCSLLTLSCALDGELSRERQSELEAHLVTCERCRTGMRYLRDETDRISQLARVEVSGATATALLERARVVVASEPPPPPAEATRPAEPGTDSKEAALDPFSMMGIATPVAPIEVAPAEGSDPDEQPSISSMTGAEQEPLADQATSDQSPAPDEPRGADLEAEALGAASQLPAAAAEAVGAADADDVAPEVERSEPADEAGAGGTQASEVNATGPGIAEAPELPDGPPGSPERSDDVVAQESSPLGASAEEDSVTGEPRLDSAAYPAGSGPGWEHNRIDVSPGPEAGYSLIDGDASPAVESGEETQAVPGLFGGDPADEAADPDAPEGQLAQEAPPWPAEPPPPAELEEEAEGQQDVEDRWHAYGASADRAAAADGPDDPPPLFVPLRIDSQDASDGAPSAASWPPDSAEVEEQAPAAPTAFNPSPSSPPSSTARQSDEVMQVALEESALLGELSNLERLPPAGAEDRAPKMAEPSIPPPPSITNRPGNRDWEPSTSLNLGLDDIAATPTLDLIGTKPKPAVEIPPALGPVDTAVARAATRPADSVAPLSGSTSSGRLQAGRQVPVPPRPRREPSKHAQAGAPPRSWTKTATIAIAALAVFLIGWSLLHHSSKPAPTPSSHHHAIVPTQSKPTPTQQPTAPTQPAVTLTSTETFGGAGSGYQVQNVRYGLHQNNTQLWVVFQLVQGSGAPKVTTGFSGQTNLYLEMAGVAPGTAVAQPAPGGLITKVTPTQVPGFSGAAYLLQLSRATKIDSAYLLPGSETSTSGERVVLELQN